MQERKCIQAGMLWTSSTVKMYVHVQQCKSEFTRQDVSARAHTQQCKTKCEGTVVKSTKGTKPFFLSSHLIKTSAQSDEAYR
eukprot:1159889-Pelagomonas_calceolata.AAC.1